MLEGFRVLDERGKLSVAKSRMNDIHKKLLEKKPLTKKEERLLKLLIWADDGPGRSFRDDKHRLQLIDQWWVDAKLHNKRLKEQEEKQAKK